MTSHAATPRRSALPLLASLTAVAGAFAFTAPAQSQDFNAMLNQQNAYLEQQIQASQARMNSQIAAGQQQVQRIVQQKMQDPRVQQAYRQHLAQAQQQGVRPYDFPTFAYYYAATNGFSAAGVAGYQSTSQDIQGREKAAWQGVKDAESNRTQAMAGLNAGFSKNLGESGRQLMGNSTYVNGNTGQSQDLPHTWQQNTYNQYQGNSYYVDASGQYWMADPNGSGNWMRMNPGR